MEHVAKRPDDDAERETADETEYDGSYRGKDQGRSVDAVRRGHRAPSRTRRIVSRPRRAPGSAGQTGVSHLLQRRFVWHAGVFAQSVVWDMMVCCGYGSRRLIHDFPGRDVSVPNTRLMITLYQRSPGAILSQFAVTRFATMTSAMAMAV